MRDEAVGLPLWEEGQESCAKAAGPELLSICGEALRPGLLLQTEPSKEVTPCRLVEDSLSYGPGSPGSSRLYEMFFLVPGPSGRQGVEVRKVYF